jgi:cobalt/nickel transport system permease protein
MATICKKKRELDYSIGVISLFIYSFFIATTKTIELLLFIPIIAQAFILRVDIKKVFKKVLKVNLFIFITFLILFLEGKTELATLVFVRANLILWFTLSFDFDGFKLYKGLTNLKVSNKFSLILFFTVKYIEVLFSNAIRVLEVLKTRGFRPTISKKTFSIYGDLLAFLLYTSVSKMEKVEDVISLRTKDGQLAPSKKIVVKLEEVLLLSVIIGVICVYYIK